jgi:hypothetical protein
VFEICGTVEPAAKKCEDSRRDQCGGVIACCTQAPWFPPRRFRCVSMFKQNWMLCRVPNMRSKSDAAGTYHAPRRDIRSSSMWILYHTGCCIMSVPGARNTRTCVEVGKEEFGPVVADEVYPHQGFARRPAKDLRYRACQPCLSVSSPRETTPSLAQNCRRNRICYLQA